MQREGIERETEKGLSGMSSRNEGRRVKGKWSWRGGVKGGGVES